MRFQAPVIMQPWAGWLVAAEERRRAAEDSGAMGKGLLILDSSDGDYKHCDPCPVPIHDPSAVTDALREMIFDGDHRCDSLEELEDKLAKKMADKAPAETRKEFTTGNNFPRDVSDLQHLSNMEDLKKLHCGIPSTLMLESPSTRFEDGKWYTVACWNKDAPPLLLQVVYVRGTWHGRDKETGKDKVTERTHALVRMVTKMDTRDISLRVGVGGKFEDVKTKTIATLTRSARVDLVPCKCCVEPRESFDLRGKMVCSRFRVSSEASAAEASKAEAPE